MHNLIDHMFQVAGEPYTDCEGWNP